MRIFVLVLRTFVPVLLAVAAVHLVYGVSAEAMLGAKLPQETINEPSLNSQNRFYGVSYALYGVVLWLCAKDINRFEPIFKAAMWISLAAGASRLVAWALHGAPAPLVVILLATELVFPVVLLLWHARVRNEA
jgi:predicted branched-subunit amino acid permease